MTTERGQLVRIPVNEIRRVGRAAKGVIIMRLNDGDRITGISKVAASEAKPAGEAPEQSENNAPVAEAPAAEVPAAEVSAEAAQAPEQE